MDNLAELEINLEHLKQNIRNLKGLLKKDTQFMAVVKTNAYGHGILECTRAAIESGVDWLGVADIDEAITLRENNIFKPILILGEVANDDLRTAANKDIAVALISLEKAREVADINFDRPLKIHLKIDTGLNRLGLKNTEITEAIQILKSHKNIIIEGVYSHLASVEKNDLAYAKLQIKNFKEAIKILKKNGIKNIMKHFAATAATMLLRETHFDMVRCGIAIYGLWPSEEIKKRFGPSRLGYRAEADREDFLKPVLTFKTQIIQIKNIKKGEKVGYACTYETKEKISIGIIPVGYYDGLDRGLSNVGEVLVGGERCPIIGRICMNMATVKLSMTNNQSPKVGDEVMIIGKRGEEEITVDEIAAKLGTSNYEIVARLPAHLPRVFLG